MSSSLLFIIYMENHACFSIYSHNGSKKQYFLVAVVNRVKLSNGKRISSQSCFNCVSRPLKFFNEPVFEAGISSFIRCKRKGITACPGENFTNLASARNLHIFVKPINNLALGMVRQNQLKIIRPCEINHCAGFRL